MFCFHASGVLYDAHQPPNVMPDQSNPTVVYSYSSETYMIKSSPPETRLDRAHYRAQTRVQANRDSYKTSITN